MPWEELALRYAAILDVMQVLQAQNAAFGDWQHDCSMLTVGWTMARHAGGVIALDCTKIPKDVKVYVKALKDPEDEGHDAWPQAAIFGTYDEENELVGLHLSVTSFVDVLEIPMTILEWDSTDAVQMCLHSGIWQLDERPTPRFRKDKKLRVRIRLVDNRLQMLTDDAELESGWSPVGELTWLL